jgi:hypothetical protein
MELTLRIPKEVGRALKVPGKGKVTGKNRIGIKS